MHEKQLFMWHSCSWHMYCLWWYMYLCVTVLTLCYSVLQVPFREAHGLSGKAVFTAESKSIALNELTVEDLTAVR